MNKLFEERDADLGFIKQYANHLHKTINEGFLNAEMSDAIRQALTLMQHAYAESLSFKHRNPPAF